jgi:uncharacterized repeat protein (TIGR01451 family)
VTSINFGSPLCTFAECGDGGGTVGPRTGDTWSWLGGIDSALEEATASQVVMIPAGQDWFLTFHLWNGASSGNGADEFRVLMDGTELFRAVEGDPTYAGGYVPVALDVTNFADGVSHELTFEATVLGQGFTSFSLDDVSILPCPAEADLAIAMGDAPDPVVAGSPLMYSLSIQNGGPHVANAVSVEDVLPAGVNFVSASASQQSHMSPRPTGPRCGGHGGHHRHRQREHAGSSCEQRHRLRRSPRPRHSQQRGLGVDHRCHV